MRDFWAASGHRLARRTPSGWLEVTDELLLAWLARPEMVPPQDACGAERALHGRLIRAPRQPVPAVEVAGLEDADARENWGLFLALRDRLLAAGTIEGAYLDIVRARQRMPPIFLDHLVQLCLRKALDGCDDPFVPRAAELFFRPQRASVRDGNLMLADAEIVGALEREQRHSPLTAMFGAQSLDTLTAENAATYWSRSDAHAMVLNFGGEPRARAGLAAAIGALVRHLLRVEVAVTPLLDVTEPDFRWFVGLDAEATAIGNALWRGELLPGLDRLIGLFRLDFLDAAGIDPRAMGHPVYLLMATSPEGDLRLKPQNLVVGLPLAEPVVGA